MAVITYWSVDNAGNIEQPQTFTPQIDPTSPTTTGQLPRPAAGPTARSPSRCRPPTSSGSGVEATYYKIGSTQPQTYTGAVQLTSATHGHLLVGRQRRQQRADAHPDAADRHHGTDDDRLGHRRQQLAQGGRQGDAHCDTDSGGSGVKATYYTMDGHSSHTYTAPFSVSSQGSHTVTYWSVDNAGNIGDGQELHREDRHHGAGGHHHGSRERRQLQARRTVVASWTATDALSGINAALTSSAGGQRHGHRHHPARARRRSRSRRPTTPAT